MPNSQRARRIKVRTLFLSDIHLGFKRARTRELHEFLQGIDAECIVLVGDIVDALSMARRFFWSAEHTEVVRTLLARQRAGARLIYIPGNHDASLGVMAEMLQANSRFTASGSIRPPGANVCWSCTAISSTGSFLARPGSRDWAM